MKKIQLGGHRFKNHPIRGYALVDYEDFEYLNQWEWSFSHGYAMREDTKNGRVYMHRAINKTPKGFDTDHVNQNKLDNRRCNLKTKTHSQNLFNTKLSRVNTSGVKGVSWYKQTKRWESYITMMGKRVRLGYFEKMQDAVKARKQGELIYHQI